MPMPRRGLLFLIFVPSYFLVGLRLFSRLAELSWYLNAENIEIWPKELL